MIEGQSSRLIEIRVHVDIEDAPHLIVSQVVVALTSRCRQRFSLEAHGLLNDDERDAGFLCDLNHNPGISGFKCQIAKVPALGDATFTNYENALLRLPERSAPPERPA